MEKKNRGLIDGLEQAYQKEMDKLTEKYAISFFQKFGKDHELLGLPQDMPRFKKEFEEYRRDEIESLKNVPQIQANQHKEVLEDLSFDKLTGVSESIYKGYKSFIEESGINYEDEENANVRQFRIWFYFKVLSKQAYNETKEEEKNAVEKATNILRLNSAREIAKQKDQDPNSFEKDFHIKEFFEKFLPQEDLPEIQEGANLINKEFDPWVLGLISVAEGYGSYRSYGIFLTMKRDDVITCARREMEQFRSLPTNHKDRRKGLEYWGSVLTMAIRSTRKPEEFT